MKASRSLIGAVTLFFTVLVTVFSSAALNAQSFVQVNSAVPASASQVAVTYSQGQVSGDLNVVVVGWNDSVATISSVTDTQGNVYTLAVGPTTMPGQLSQSIYFAKNIVAATAGSNTVTVNFTGTANHPDVRILEYSGLDANNPLDGATGASGNTAVPDSGAVSTANANDLLVGASTASTSTAAPGTGFTARIVTSPNGNLAEDEGVTVAGSYHATSTLSVAGAWVMQVVALRTAGAPPSPSAPGTLTANSVSSSQINLSWLASSESGGTISSYSIERCPGAGCGSFAPIGVTGTTSFNDTGLAGGTSYTYRVRAKDTANNLGPYSNTATATTPGSPTPTAPTNLTAVSGSLAPVVVAVQGYINSNLLASHTTAAFNSTGGDLIVMCASSHMGVTFTPSDSFGNVWISAAGPTNTSVGFDLRTQVWYARNPIVGPNHTVTMNLSIPESLVISIIVVKGSKISSPIDTISAIGSDNGTLSPNIATPSITTTAVGDLIIGFAKVSNGSVFQPGTGFTQQAGASSNYLDAETGVAPTLGTYTATFTIDQQLTWQAVAAAVNPAAGGNPNQVNLSWTAATETGGTIGAYLIERCQGAGCNSFSQIGTSASTAYNDATVTASATYNYRVRAQDTSGNVGPYSNVATITTPSALSIPTITSLSPASGIVGTPVTITGTNFGGTQGISTVSFNGTLGTPTSWSDTSIVVPVPLGTTTGNVTVTAGGQTSNSVAFTMKPNITNLLPVFGPVGTSVTITGTNFGGTQGISTVSFNGTAAAPTSWSNTSISVPVPAGATSGNVTVTVSGQTSNGMLFTVGSAPPPGTITHIQQASNSDITGRTYTSFTAAFPATTAGNAIIVGITYGNVNPTITATDSQGNTYARAIATYDAGHNQGCAILYATNIKGGASNTVSVNFSSAVGYVAMGIHEYNGVAGTAALDGTTGIIGTGSSPSSGSATTTANGDLIFGCGAEDSVGHGDTFTAASGFTKRVDLGNAAAYADEDAIQGVAGSIAASWTLSPSGSWVANMAAFKAAAAGTGPVITSLSPTSGIVGTPVTITGTNFGTSTGTVSFNGTAGTPTSWSDTSIVVPVPAGASTGNVTVTAGGQTSNGVAFTVVPNITTLSPASGIVGTPVTITGTNFGTSTGTVSFNGTAATPTSWSDTSIVVPVPAGASTGNVTVTAGGQTSNGVAFTVKPNITTLSPVSGIVGTPVTITGTNFGTSTGTVSFNGTAGTPTSWSNTSIVVPVPAGATTGNVTVTAGGQTSSGIIFTVGVTVPNITSLSPVSGIVGTPVTITGTNFGTSTGTVSFNGTAATPTSWSDTSIVVPVPAGATTGNVTVTAGGQTSNGVAFTVKPNITTLSPVSGIVGTPVTITGTNFGTSTGTVSFNGTAGTPTSWSDTSIVVPVPAGATTGNVTVTSGGQTSSGIVFTVGVTVPNITSLSPVSGIVGTPVTITGTNFGTSTGAVSFNGTAGTPTSWSDTSIVVPVPAGATTGNVTVTAGGQTSNGVAFTVKPNITSLSPVSGIVGTPVTITGTNFGTSTGTVSFNGTAATPTSWSDTSIVVPVPAGATTGNVTVTAGGQTSNGVAFTVKPNITSLSPVSGIVGTPVTITGTNFGTSTGTVSFNGTAGTPTSWSNTSIVVPVPAGATTGNVIVTAGGQTSNGVAFTVKPNITSLSPVSGIVGTPVTITGTNFGTSTGTVSFNGTAGTPTSWSNTSIVVPVPAGATTGNVIVTAGGQTSNGMLFTVGSAPPPGTITHIQQASNSDITGRGYTSFTATFPATTAGNAIVVGITYGNVNPTITATDSQGNTYARAIATYDAGHSQGCAILYATNIKGGASNTVSVNFSSAVGYVAMGIHEYNGVAATLALDGTAGSQGTWTNPSSGSATTTANGDLIFGCGAEDSVGHGDTFTAASGFTKRVDLGNAAAYADEDAIQGVAGSIAASWTLSPSGSWVANMAAFKAAAAGTGPVITSLSPTLGIVGTPVTITGTNFGTSTGTVSFNGTAGTPTIWSNTSIVVPVPAGATTGNVTVTAGGQTSSGIIFTVGVTVPNITSLSPVSGIVGTPVTITGTNFGTSTGTVSFNGTAATPTSWSDTSIVVPVPAGATTGNVTVTAGGQTSNGVAFTVKPNITTLSPVSGIVGTPVTITGTNFGTSTGTVSFNGTAGTPTSWSDTSIVVPVPAGATTGNVTVTSGGQTSSGIVFTVGVTVPNITSLSPVSGIVGTPVTITGTNFGTSTGAVSFNGTAGTPTSWSDTSIVVPVPAGATTGNVTVTAGGQTSNGVAFTVKPNITSLSPVSGIVGTPVTITGTNFGTSTGTVSFNGTAATPTSWSDTSIVVPVPAGATTGNVTVTAGGQTSNGVAFTVKPNITSLSPVSGIVGTPVTITGTNFGTSTGTVSFNGTAGTPTSWSNTSIVVPVPAGATTGNVIVTAGGQTSNGMLFTVGSAPPPGTITHIQQASNSDITGRGYTSFTATFPATTAGNAIVVGITYGNVNPTITATDSQGNTYARAIATYDAGHSQGCAILYATNIKGGASNTVSVNFSSAVGYVAMGIHEYNGVAATLALDGTAGSQGTWTNPSSGSATTTANGDLIFGCGAEDSVGHGDTFTAASGFTKRVDLGNAAAYADEDAIQGVAGSIAASWTLSPSGSWVANMAAFKAGP